MQIISFAWTTDALLSGRKSVTRRDWPDSYAQQFHPGDLVQGYDKGARCGGQRRAIIRLEDLHREPLSRLTDDPEYGRSELIKEGNLWASVEEFLALFGALKHGDPYRVQFRIEEIEGEQLALPIADPVPAIHADFCRITNQQLKLSVFLPLWKDLIHTHGYTAEDVTLTARYLMREVQAARRQSGCLKIHNFANPVFFAGDLSLAQRVQPRKSAAKLITPAEPPKEVQPASEEGMKQMAADLAAWRKSLHGGKSRA